MTQRKKPEVKLAKPAVTGKYMKCLEPGKTYTYVPAEFPQTVFTFEAFSGAHFYTDSEEIMQVCNNTCVLSVTNIALPIKDGNGVVEVKCFDEFIPREHPTIELNACLDHIIATALFSHIWAVSKLTATESGE